MYGELDEEAIEKVLRSATVGRFGLWDGERSYVFPITYLYDPENRRLLGHTLPGQKLDLLRSVSEVHFQVDIVDDPFNWRSVMAWGQYAALEEEEAALDALERMARAVTRRHPSVQKPTEDALEEVATHATVYEITIDEWTGRFERRVDKTGWTFPAAEGSSTVGPFHAGRRPSSLHRGTAPDTQE